MLEQGVALAQSPLPGANLQQAAGVVSPAVPENGSRGGVVAGVQSQDRPGHVLSSVRASAPFSGLGGVSANSARTKEPRIPFRNETTSAGS